MYDIVEKTSAAVSEKHKKYHKSYKPNDIFWGLGVEHEVYLELQSDWAEFSLTDMKRITKRERYSHDYFASYRPGVYDAAIDYLISQLGENHRMRMPVLMNAHSFQKTDLSGEHATLYVTGSSRPNPAFSGTTVFESLRAANPYFSKEYEHSFLFDGDTIEFTTSNFYNATADEVMDELHQSEARFIQAMNESYPKPVQIARKNYGLATYLTNRRNVAVFNNGTIHINLTLPTRLNAAANIADWPDFVIRHRRLARLIQWLEPFMVAIYCTPDPFIRVPELTNRLSHVSQRLAMSRYIGIGTYDTKKMQPGKILTCPVEEGCPWYKTFHADSGYVPLKNIGMDINFNKHYNHGLELRFFDSAPLEKVGRALNECCLLARRSEAMGRDIEDPRACPVWNGLVVNVMCHGKEHVLSGEEIERLENVLGITLRQKKVGITVEEMYISLIKELGNMYVNIPMTPAKQSDATVAAAAEPAVPAPVEVPVAKTSCTIFNPKTFFSWLNRRSSSSSSLSR
jgi:hypothetical protein